MELNQFSPKIALSHIRILTLIEKEISFLTHLDTKPPPELEMQVFAVPMPASQTDNRKAAYFFILGIIIGTAMVWMVKTLGNAYGPFQILFARSAVMAICLLPFLMLKVAKTGLSQSTSAFRNQASPLKMASRSLLAFGGQAFGIAAITNLPLAQLHALSFTKGFIVLALAVIILREKVGVRRWASMGLGFLGVIIAVQPGTAFEPAALYAILSAVCFAISTIVLKQLTQETDNLTLMAWGSLAQTIMALPLALFWWVQPNIADFAIMISLGLAAIIMQNTMLAAYRIGDVSALSPLDYLRLITGTLLGFFAFGEVPNIAIFIGAALIIIANLTAMPKNIERP